MGRDAMHKMCCTISEEDDDEYYCSLIELYERIWPGNDSN